MFVVSALLSFGNSSVDFTFSGSATVFCSPNPQSFKLLMLYKPLVVTEVANGGCLAILWYFCLNVLAVLFSSLILHHCLA